MGVTGSAIWRMRAALRHRDRGEREISPRGWYLSENLSGRQVITFPHWGALSFDFHGPDIPATFLRKPDQSGLRLRHLRSEGVSFPSVASGLLSSATALTDLTLDVRPNVAAFDSPQGSSLLACSQVIECLRSLDLKTSNGSQDSQSQHSTFNSQRYCSIIETNTFSLSRPYQILEHFHVRAFSSIPPRCLPNALDLVTHVAPPSVYRRREGRILVNQYSSRYRIFRPLVADPLGET